MALTAAAAAKIAATVLTNEKLRKTAGWIIAAILSPLILLLVIICSFMSGGADHNVQALELSYYGGMIAGEVPEAYRQHIEDIRASFAILEGNIASINAMTENGNGLDSHRVKAIFYSLFFGAENLRMDSSDFQMFVNCFVQYEERTRTVTDGNGHETSETYIAAVPLDSLPEIYASLENTLGRSITHEERANASEIYYRVLYGGGIPTYGEEFNTWSNGLPLSSAPFVGADGFCSPLGEGWRGMVTSEFGRRIDPITRQPAGHTGIDLGAPTGTPIRAALDGTVQFVRYKATGYGYHLAIDHGGGFVTLYAHCSKILVTEGQRVTAGDIIAQVGSTGKSTGPHLHFEVRIKGEMKNPRSYLP